MKTAFGLLRVSRTEQDTLSQKLQLKRIAEEKGYMILDEGEGHDFFSEKVTGYDEQDYDRDSIVQLKNQIQIRKPDAIFCLELSRLTRRATKVSHYIDELSIVPKIPMYFADYDIWTIDPETHKQNDDGIMTLYGGARSVEIERERIRSRTSRGRDTKAEKGYYVGHLKDGYKWEYDDNNEKIIVVDEQRRKMIETIFDLYYHKEYSTAEIRDYLNARNFPTTNKYRYEHPILFKGYKQEYVDKSGDQHDREDTIWMDSSVSSILKDEWYVGIRRYHGKEYHIEPIVDREVWEGCQKRLKQFRKRVSTAKQPYLLGGLMYCGNCGRKMYGHSDGGYGDMYYCSSYEYGTKNRCGLRWIRRQNIESIIMGIVKRRVYSDITLGEKSPFSDFFSVDGVKLQDIDGKIATYKTLIKKIDEDNMERDKQISFLIAQQAKRYNNKDLVSQYEDNIDKIEKEKALKRKERLDYEVSIDRLKKQKKMFASVNTRLSEINNLEDYSKARALLQSVIQRIKLYNSDKTSTIIEIEYVHGKKDTAVYNPIRMKKKFILLSMEEWGISKYLKYDTETKKIVFNGCYLACSDGFTTLFDEEEPKEDPILKEIRESEGRVRLGKWDTPENRERYVNEMIKLGIEKEEAIKQYEDAVEKKLIWKDISDGIEFYEAQGCAVFKDEVSVLDYIEYKKNTRFCVFPFADLLPMSERGERVKKYHQEYIKRYNTGGTFAPFVVKDADYKQICKKRKYLYNRKYKILHNKHLTQAQKDEQIFKIMEQLEAYKYQIKYMPTNKKAKDIIEKQKNKE